ncbi:ABC transporter permease [Streptomyces sp. CC219B]|uniref:ABC transporter permease n=1 Tax=Streptomyces sp. CC219B TaxID=3044574 RepID=UPI0024A86AA6|nr:ABC transporter permease [Streptomyces sp. CC219B]
MTTTVTVEAPATRTAPRPGGLLWAMLRIHRSALWFWLMLMALAGGALLWVYGPGADAAWEEYRQMRCGSDSPGRSCDYTGPAMSRYDLVLGTTGSLMSLVPLLAAAWAGGALIARELETGTARLAWTQSVSPARWLAAKLAVPAALIAVGMLTLTLLHRLVWTTGGELHRTFGLRMWHNDAVFTANGTLATAYALLGLAVGALVGLLLPRALAALGVAATVVLVLLIQLMDLRPHLWPVKTAHLSNDYYINHDYSGALGTVTGDGALTSTGARVPVPDCVGEPRCLSDRDITGFYVDYHPPAHFWPLQLMETGVVLAVAAVAVAASFWLLNRRTGAAA